MRCHRPKWLRLKRMQERRIERLLNLFPHTAPEITIRPYDGEPFEVAVLGAPECFVPAEIGAEEVYADYSNIGVLLEANHLRVARRVRVNGAWCFEAYETGGPFIDNQIEVVWYHPQCYRIGHDIVRGFDEGNLEEFSAFPRRLGPSSDVPQIGGAGTDIRVAGFSMVGIAGKPFQCMHVRKVDRFEEDGCLDGDPWLEDIYFTREGRMLLTRKYLSTSDLVRETERCGAESNSVEAAEVDGITYNGLEYLPWFDMLSGLALGINPRTT